MVIKLWHQGTVALSTIVKKLTLEEEKKKASLITHAVQAALAINSDEGDSERLFQCIATMIQNS